MSRYIVIFRMRFTAIYFAIKCDISTYNIIKSCFEMPNNISPQESAGHHISLQGGVLGGSGANCVSDGKNTTDMKPLIIRHVTVGDKQFNIVVDERGIPSIAPLGILGLNWERPIIQ